MHSGSGVEELASKEKHPFMLLPWKRKKKNRLENLLTSSHSWNKYGMLDAGTTEGQ